ncbi:MAG: hypothetical protein HC930_16810 [Hydrococcus sp. SU_1_0]|nr:hypothetical protein [Hydrococcus sp. SU_1_0]
MAFQLSTTEIDNIMTGDQNWSTDGLGKSGEVNLVGSDFGMRSISRFLIEQPQEYFKAIAAQGLSPKKIDQIKIFNNSILHQEVHTPAIEQAVDHQTGFMEAEDYRGVATLNAYRPLDLDNLDWVINAKVDIAEALEPIKDFSAKYS